MDNKLKYNQKGQVMLITTLVLMSTFALSITIGGLVLFNIRASVSTGESTKAIYAAESCLEHQLYLLNKGQASSPDMTNGAEYSDPIPDENGIICTGSSGRVNRAFEITF